MFVALALVSLWPGMAAGQHIYLDSDGDGISAASDRLPGSGVVSVDVWLVTDENRDGARVKAGGQARPLSVFSYEFILAAVGGTVSWGVYSNLQEDMNVSFGRHESDTELYVGYGGTTSLPPGKYKLGTLEVRAKSGTPQLEFRSKAAVHPYAFTSFGSLNRGKDDDHTIKLAQSPGDVGRAEVPGDFSDSDGLGISVAGASGIAGVAETLRFGVSATQGSNAKLRVTTSKTGFLRVRLFDIQGRIVGTLVAREDMPAGAHEFTVARPTGGGQKLSSGVYFYRVEAVEGQQGGRVVLVH
jgi:hypothetical protein